MSVHHERGVGRTHGSAALSGGAQAKPYALTVYAGCVVPERQLAAIVESVPGLSAGGVGDDVVVLRGKQKIHAFTVTGPRAISARHVPEHVSSRIVAPTASWRVTVAGNDPAQVRCARRFAKALALATGGVVVDEQTENIPGPKPVRKASRSTTAAVRILDLRWYSPASAPNAPAEWVETAKKFLPEALPRRFGNVYPLAHRLDRDGGDRFISSYCDVAWFDGTYPCLDGGLYPNERDGILVDRLRLVVDPLEEPRRRNTVRRFFVEYARRRGSILATGEVLRNHKLTGHADGNCDLSGSLRGPDGILGLPANPIWWTWLGEDYLPLVRTYLPPERTTCYSEGVLYVPTENPADRSQLANLPDPFPTWLRATAVPSEFGTSIAPRNAPAPIRPIISVV
ncbi:hypothetical protein MSAS_53590 [Mycobacterium saskatchewanense]|uniref:Uncharacterized protein n=1 Tax=Mycobacterium saskatchewanense TaxID=220927 RepID=A0A1X2C4Z8_9MYCO|nr:hypothetical protein [Mycobacterium saskatchewanense]ORW70992.1 hypothetical protein AWC23_15200 [Mycobacterium saskatchewanense]BBX66185.1 hypothetical protein MSAS_53590 [Mycobacterium saskatchewanense]